MSDLYYLYLITNRINGKCYVGLTNNPHKRWIRHKCLSNGKEPYQAIHKAIKKYGKNNFCFEVVACSIGKNSAAIVEQHLIEQHNTIINGYNMTDGGWGGDNSHLQSFKESMKRHHDQRDRKTYATYGTRGKTPSESTKSKIRKSIKNKWKQGTYSRLSKLTGDKNPAYGKSPPNSIPVKIKGMIYPSLAAASRSLKMTTNAIKKEYLGD